MTLYQLKTSFAGGELSPAMYGRIDIAKYDSGAAKLQNFLVLRYGGAANRAGFRFIAASDKRATLIPFTYSADQNYIVEITAGKCRFYKNGEIIKNNDNTPYSITNLFVDNDLENPEKIKYTQSADVVFIVHPSHAPMTLTRYGELDWRFEVMDITGGPFDDSKFNSEIVMKSYSNLLAGSYEFVVPEKVDKISIELAAAGGGGGGGMHLSHFGHSYGGGGGRGEVVAKTISVTPGEVFAYTIGSGGIGGINGDYHPNNTNGAVGGASKFGDSIVARGGGGGGRAPHSGDTRGPAGTSYGNGGAGGAGGGWNAGRAGSGSSGWININYGINVGANISVSASEVFGDVTLTATGNIFSESDVDTLFALNHFVASEYKKDVPEVTGSDLSVAVLPKSNVYVESFGFWDGNFSLEKYDTVSAQWVNMKTQSGNRSQNYNFTQTNDSDSIANYRITTTEFNNNTWSGENEKQRGYVTIQSIGGDYSGHILITEYISPTQVKGTVKTRLASTVETKDFAFAAWNATRGYPFTAGFYEDRLVFAGNRSQPQTFWTSKTADYYNLSMSIPLVDDDGIKATLNGGQMNGIKAIVAFGEMILLTAGGEYKVSGGGKPITGTNVLSQPQEYRGISDVSPVTVGSRIVYVQQQGNIIRDLAYSYDVDKYTGDDLNLLATHLFEGHKIISMTYQQIPNSIIWCVRDDGLLLGLTYLKEQDVFAWHQHTTNGKFINVCSISGKSEDELYAVIERGGKYYIEKMESRDKSLKVDDQFFVDSGVTYDGEATDIITGLEHLEGYDVSILADGNVLPRQEVEDGTIRLGNKYSKVHVGLPINAILETLPIEFNGQDGTHLSRSKRISLITLMLKDSRGGLYGLSGSNLDEFKWRSNEAYGTPIELKTDKFKKVLPGASWGKTQQIVIKQLDPLPLTVLALVPEIEG